MEETAATAVTDSVYWTQPNGTGDPSEEKAIDCRSRLSFPYCIKRPVDGKKGRTHHPQSAERETEARAGRGGMHHLSGAIRQLGLNLPASLLVCPALTLPALGCRSPGVIHGWEIGRWDLADREDTSQPGSALQMAGPGSQPWLVSGFPVVQ